MNQLVDRRPQITHRATRRDSRWSAIPLKRLIVGRVTDGPHETPDFTDEGVPFLSVDGIQDGRLVFAGCRHISREDHRRYSRKCRPQSGDVLLGKAASVGKVALVETEREFNVWSPLALIRPDRRVLSSRFLYYSLVCRNVQQQIDVLCSFNTQRNIGMRDIEVLRLDLPPLPEQRAIADFLDRKTAAIDELIRAKERLIELLQEKRQVLITQAVTKGLDPSVPMKDSGIEWLGEVPTTWSVIRIGYMAQVKTGGTPSRSDPSNFGGDIPWVRSTEVQGRLVSSTEHTLSQKGLASSSCDVLPPGTVLVAMYGQGATRGRAAVLDTSAAVNQACAAILPCPGIDPQLLWMTLCAAYSALRSEAMGGQQPNLSLEDVRAFRIPVPPRSVQSKIVEYFESQYAHSVCLESDVSEQIEGIVEYRQALISAAVTGQIDVHAESPDEVPV